MLTITGIVSPQHHTKAMDSAPPAQNSDQHHRDQGYKDHAYAIAKSDAKDKTQHVDLLEQQYRQLLTDAPNSHGAHIARGHLMEAHQAAESAHKQAGALLKDAGHPDDHPYAKEHRNQATIHANNREVLSTGDLAKN
jgi:hypothetical protein